MPLFAFVFVGSTLVAACGANITPKQIDEPCTRTSQCDTGLVCLTGVCQLDPEAGTGGAGGSP
jgi:hypothetical protein